MRLKEYPEIIVDVIPKLYEEQTKVFITHLYGMEEQLCRLPKKFCKMYTTAPLANQLFFYLTERGATISRQDFHLLQELKPFVLRLSDGKRLELMLVAGNQLRSSLMLLIRKVNAHRLLYYYSAVQQHDLCYLMGNVTFKEWILLGTELLFVNLQAADEPFTHIDYDAVAMDIVRDSQAKERATLLKLPLFGYEYLIQRLAQTYALHGHIKLIGKLLESYTILSSDLSNFEQPAGYVERLHIVSTCEWETKADQSYELRKLGWSPVPNRINLIQLCSLLRPMHISGIVGYQAAGNVPPVSSYLKRFKFKYAQNIEFRVPETQLLDVSSNIIQMECTSPANSSGEIRKEPLIITKQRKLAYVDDDDDDDDE